MKLVLPTTFVEEQAAETKDKYLKECLKTNKYARKVELDSKLIDRQTLKGMMLAARTDNLRFTQVLESAWAMSKTHKSEKFSTIKEAFDSLKMFFDKALTQNGWLYSRDNAGIFQPWAITKMVLNTRTENNHEYNSSINIELQCTNAISGSPNKKELHVNLTTFYSFLLRIGLNGHINEEMEYGKEERPDSDVKRTYVKVRHYRNEFYDVLVGVDVLDKEKRPSVLQLLEYWEMHAETEELSEIYEKYMTRFQAFLPLYGKQFVVRGLSMLEDGDYYSMEADMSVDGQPGRAIMTTIPAAATILQEEGSEEEEARPRSFGYGYRHMKPKRQNENEPWLRDIKTLDIPLNELTEEDLKLVVETDKDGKKENIQLPIDPSLHVYHLEKHDLFKVHASNMAPYKYREDITKMLVLPEEMKELCEMLVSNEGEEGEDVIANKGQSTVIACIGDPGLGKTLMAEVLAEGCKKPLYKIQAAQLGLTSEELETTLLGILKKAEVWGCVLLIDEANAYIHERGHDIRQNAIVGVFLRLLEYFKGICILTTNHSNEHGEIDIDDAIVQRCAAIIRFELPTQENAKKIWKIQAKLLKAKMSEELVDKLVKAHTLSGRSIRQLLRLSIKFATRKKEELTFEHFQACSKYISVTRSERFSNSKPKAEKAEVKT